MVHSTFHTAVIVIDILDMDRIFAANKIGLRNGLESSLMLYVRIPLKSYTELNPVIYEEGVTT